MSTSDRQEQWLSSLMETIARRVFLKAPRIHIRVPEKERFCFFPALWAFLSQVRVMILSKITCLHAKMIILSHTSTDVDIQVCIMQQVKKMHLPTRQKSWDVQVMNAKEKKDRYSIIAFRLHRRLKSEPIAVQLYNVVSLVLRDQTTLKYSSHQSKGRVVIERYGCSSILKIQSSVTRVQ